MPAPTQDLLKACRANPNVCRVAYYTDMTISNDTYGIMYVKCPCPKRCVNQRKYHMYTITEPDTVESGGTDGRSSHCSVVGSGKPIVLLFEENEHKAQKIPHDLNLTTGHIYKRRRRKAYFV